MKKLAPTRQFFDRAKGHITVRAQLPELSDWSLKDISIFCQVPVLTQLSRSGWPDDPCSMIDRVWQRIILQLFIGTRLNAGQRIRGT
jgi:hypothetical protein